MIVLGIETTCDETAAAVVERFEDGRGKILSNVILSQVREHAAFGGVVPEIAARAHVETLDGIIGRAMAQANCSYDAINAIAAAGGPGLIGGVMPTRLATAVTVTMVSFVPGYNLFGLAVTSVTASAYARMMGRRLIDHFEREAALQRKAVQARARLASKRGRRWLNIWPVRPARPARSLAQQEPKALARAEP